MAKIIQLIIFLTCLAIVVHSTDMTEEFQEEMNKIHDKCVKEIGIDEDLIHEAREGNFTEDGNLKCYMKCLLVAMEVVTDTEDIDYDALIKFIPENFKEVGTKMVNDCRETTGEDLCEKAFNFNVCVHKSNPEEYCLA